MSYSPPDANVVHINALRATRAVEDAVRRYGERLAAAEEVCRLARLVFPELPAPHAAKLRDALEAYDTACRCEITQRPKERT